MTRPLTWFAILGVSVFLVFCMGFLLPFELALTLVAGWPFYLARVIPQVKVDGSGIVTATVCLALFTVGLHQLLRWFREPMRENRTSGTWKLRWTASLVLLILVMFISGISTVGMVHQVGWLLTAREPLFTPGALLAARRSQSMNNLKQIALGLHGYEAEYGLLPPGGTFDKQNMMLHGWQTRILPYMEQSHVYNRIALDRPWDDPVNGPAFRARLNVFLVPGASLDPVELGYSPSHYAGNVFVLGGDRSRGLTAIPDGSSNTMLAGEVAGEYRPWGYPANWRDPTLGLNRSPKVFGSPFPGGANVLMGDGSVRFMKDTIDPRVLKALSTPDGGEVVPGDAFN